MRTKRDRRPALIGELASRLSEADEVGTPTNTTLVAVSTAMELSWDEAVDREATELKADTASDFYLKAKGHLEDKDIQQQSAVIEKSKSESKDIARLITVKKLYLHQLYVRTSRI